MQRVAAAISALADIGYRGQTMQPVQRNRQRPISIAQLGDLLAVAAVVRRCDRAELHRRWRDVAQNAIRLKHLL